MTNQLVFNQINTQIHFHEKLLISRLDTMCIYYKKYLNQCFDAQMNFYLHTKTLHRQIKNKTLPEKSKLSETKSKPNPETNLQYVLKRYNTVCRLHHLLRSKEEGSIKIKQFNTLFYTKESQALFNQQQDVWGSQFLKIVDELLTVEWSKRFSHAVLVFRNKHRDSLIKNVPLN